MKKSTLFSCHGQMLLVVILIMVVSLTIGLAVASRTITNLKISKENEESQRAFQAAEAGLEIARKIIEKQRQGITLSQGEKDLANSADFSITSPQEALPITGGALNDDQPIDQDKGIDIWLMPYSSFIGSATQGSYNGTVELRWSANSNCSGSSSDPAALEIFIVQGSKSSPTIRKYIYDRCGKVSGNIINPNVLVGTYKLSTGAFPPAGDPAIANGILIKAIPLYNSARMYINTAGGLPTQGKIIYSQGRSGSTVRKIKYFEANPVLPSELFYSILSQ